jgi:hypothetical protein
VPEAPHQGIRFRTPAIEGEEWTVRSVDESGDVICESARERRVFPCAVVEDGIARSVATTLDRRE